MANEFEQRFLVDPLQCPALSQIDFWIYHQAEVGSWKVSNVVQDFINKVDNLLDEEALSQFHSIVSQMLPGDKVKIRIRDILRYGEVPRAELTVKKKYPDINWYKHYDEDNIPVSPEVAQKIIWIIAPPINIGKEIERGVYKHRHFVYPRGKKSDLDVLRRANTGPITLEIEVDSPYEVIIPPSYVVCKINGRPEFKMFWTWELQIKPWALLSGTERKPYFDALKRKYK